MYGLLVGFGLMFDKGQKQSSTLSCDSSYYTCFALYNCSPPCSFFSLNGIYFYITTHVLCIPKIRKIKSKAYHQYVVCSYCSQPDSWWPECYTIYYT